jgi:hypothetical protein
MEGKRSALIVANDRYQDLRLRQLRAPTRDAEALARVLSHPDIGNFQVKVVTNEPEHRLRREIAAFFADRERDDLVLAHFSCHGVKDDSGQLYFATPDTELQNLDATAVPADFVNRHMTRSRSRRVVLLLDCCYSGAFARGMLHRADTAVDLGDRFEGRGRIVLTASSAMEYAFEDAELSHAEGQPSVFTRALVQGLHTGDADRDGDGRISVDELYDYVFDQVRAATPKQTPGRWDFELQGDFLIAHSRHLRPATLPPELQQALEHPVAGVRLGAVGELERMLRGHHPGFALAARQALERLRGDDSQRVSSAATSGLATADAGRPEPQQAAPTRSQPGSAPSGRSAPAPRPATGRPPSATQAKPQPERAAYRPTVEAPQHMAAGRMGTSPRPKPRPSGSRAPATGELPTGRGQAGKTPKPAVRRARLVLLLPVLLLLGGGIFAASSLRSGHAREIRIGERFTATSPWRLQVRGDDCDVRLADGYGATRSEGHGSNFFLQLRETGEFQLSALTGGCNASVLAGAGRTVNLPLALDAGADGAGGDTLPFHSSGGFRITIKGTSCQTAIYRALEGSLVEEFGSNEENTPINQSGDFYVRSDVRCSTTIDSM